MASGQAPKEDEIALRIETEQELNFYEKMLRKPSITLKQSMDYAKKQNIMNKEKKE